MGSGLLPSRPAEVFEFPMPIRVRMLQRVREVPLPQPSSGMLRAAVQP